jgi:hypothetical protein
MSSFIDRNAVGETGDGWVTFAIEVRVPMRQAPILADAMTGNDDDVVLAAEKAMRERIEDAVLTDAEEVEARDGRYAYDLDERIELAPISEKVVKEFMADVMGPRQDGETR